MTAIPENPAANVAARSLRGHLSVVCAPDERGVSILRRQSFRAPLHLSKPHWDAGSLVVNVVNPTAGLFDGDEVSVEAEVEGGASLVLTSPSATRVFRSRSGRPATVMQRLQVKSGGYLEVFPEAFIPQAAARYRQQTTVEAEVGAAVIFFEWLAPGRAAMGEAYAFSDLRWETDFMVGGVLAARERFRLRPGDESLAALRWMGPETHYIGCLVAGIDDWPAQALEALGSEAVYLGHGPLTGQGRVIKALCRDSLAARRTMHGIRQALYRAMGRPVPGLGRF